MTMQDTNPDDVIDAVEQVTGWTLEDYHYAEAMDEDATLTLELTADGTPDLSTYGDGTELADAKELIADLEKTHDEGAPTDTVKRAVVENTDLTPDEATDAIESLRRLGEIYEPRTDYLRTT